MKNFRDDQLDLYSLRYFALSILVAEGLGTLIALRLFTSILKAMGSLWNDQLIVDIYSMMMHLVKSNNKTNKSDQNMARFGFVNQLVDEFDAAMHQGKDVKFI